MYKNMSTKQYRKAVFMNNFVLGALTGISSTAFVVIALQWAHII
jgi:hypothetical protein